MKKTTLLSLIFAVLLPLQAQIRVTPGQDLQAAVSGAAAGSTILVDPGTYALASMLIVNKPLTIRASAPGVVLRVADGQFAAVQVVANNVTLDGLSVANGCWGIYVADFGGASLANVTLSHLTVDTTFCSSTPGHGIYLGRVHNSAVVDSTVVKAYADGILLDKGSSGNLVANNTVQQTQTQHGIALLLSDSNIVTGNSVTSSAFFCLILVGSSYNRVERNVLTGDHYGGIVVTDNNDPSNRVTSVGNYIGQNTVVSSSLAFGSGTGAGIWLDSESNSSLVYLNTASGAGEGGLEVFNSSNNYLAGNVARHNNLVGIFVARDAGSRGPAPQRNYLHQNFVNQDFTDRNPHNGCLQTNTADLNDIAYNYALATQGLVGTGIQLQTSGSNRVYRNSLRNLGFYFFGDVTNTTYFENRHFNAGDKYILSPATVSLDAGAFLGGNYWDDFPVTGNPSQGTPYKNFLPGGTSGPYADNYPFQSEGFGKPQSVQVLKPYAGQVLGAGTGKAIQWRAEGCALVDLAYQSSSTGLQTIATNYPEVGYYQWTVPTQAASDYTIRITCKSVAGAVGVTGVSDVFTVAAAGLALLAPGPAQRVAAGAPLWVSWRKPAGAGAVNVFLRGGASASWTQVASNVTADAVSITAPALASNRVSVLVQSAANAGVQDSSDGFVMVRGSAGSFTAAPAALALIGQPTDLEWISPDGSQVVDLEFYDTDSQVARPVAIGLADFGFYRWLPPDAGAHNGYLRATFHNAAGASMGSSQSATFQLVYTLPMASGFGLIPVAPCRVADTRNATGPFGGPILGGNTRRSFAIPASGCGIPSSAKAYSLNLTVVPSGRLSYLTVFPSGQSQPLVSTLNSFEGRIVANAAILPAGTNGSIDVFVTDDTHLVLDIDGYFDAGSAALPFYGLTPCRVADTRNAASTFGGPSMSAGQARSFPMTAASCGIPAAAQAFSLNATVVPAGVLGYLTLFPTGQARPLVSTLNSLDGRVVANAALVPAGTGTGGAVSVFVTDPTDVIIDVNGYFGTGGSGTPLAFYPLAPCRVADTRNAAGTFGGPSLGASGTRVFPIPQSGCGVPAAARAYSLNVTVVPRGPLGYLSIWPSDQPQPLVSTLNSFQGSVVANAAIVPASASGSVSVYVTDATDVILDINGYFAR